MKFLEILTKLYYRLTAYVPRKIPSTPDEYQTLVHVLINAYGVPDDPKSWATVAGHLTSVPATKLRYPWGSLANAAKRLQTNALAQHQRMAATAVLREQQEAQIKAAIQAETDRVQKEQQYHVEGSGTIEPKTDALSQPQASEDDKPEEKAPQ